MLNELGIDPNEFRTLNGERPRFPVAGWTVVSLVILTLSLRVILVGLLWSLKLVVGWNLKERRIGLGAGQVLGFSCGAVADLSLLREDSSALTV
jgi:hypothetical protein